MRASPESSCIRPEPDYDQERSCFLANEQSWRTVWRARSLLGWTNPDSGTTIIGLRAPTVALRETQEAAPRRRDPNAGGLGR